MVENSYFGLLRVCCEIDLLKETNHTTCFQGVKMPFLLSGSDRKLPYFIKNGTHRFIKSFSRDFYFKEVIDINAFEVSKFGRTIEWQSVLKFFI